MVGQPIIFIPHLLLEKNIQQQQKKIKVSPHLNFSSISKYVIKGSKYMKVEKKKDLPFARSSKRSAGLTVMDVEKPMEEKYSKAEAAEP